MNLLSKIIETFTFYKLFIKINENTFLFSSIASIFIMLFYFTFRRDSKEVIYSKNDLTEMIIKMSKQSTEDSMYIELIENHLREMTKKLSEESLRIDAIENDLKLRIEISIIDLYNKFNKMEYESMQRVKKNYHSRIDKKVFYPRRSVRIENQKVNKLF